MTEATNLSDYQFLLSFSWTYRCVLPVTDCEDAEMSVVSFLEATCKDFRLKVYGFMYR